MSDLLSIGGSGVRAYQSALTTVSENIANVGTPGYSRRTATLKEVAASGGISQPRVGGLGVRAAGVSRAGSPFVEQGVRDATADLSRTEAGATWLDRIETALTGDKLAERLTGFFTAGKALAAEPSSTPLRQNMLEAATSAASAFAATGQALDRAAADLDDAGAQAASELSSLAAGLARVNRGLGRAQPDSSAAAALLDQRDQILEQMSALSDLSVRFDSLGRADVALGGAGGAALVQGEQSGQLVFGRTGANATLAVLFGADRTAVSPTGGALAGIVEGADRIAGTRQSLNAVAKDFTDAVNDFQAAGEDLDGQPGQPIFAAGATPTDLDVVLADPRGVAAAKPGGGTRDASNLAALESTRVRGGFENGFGALVAGNASALSQRRLVAEAQGSIRDGATAARASASGVNLDDEAVELMRFQQAYQASSRVIQVAREIFQSIIQIG